MSPLINDWWWSINNRSPHVHHTVASICETLRKPFREHFQAAAHPTRETFPGNLSGLRKPLGKSGKVPDLGSEGSGGHLYCEFEEKVAGKLRRMFRLHLGLITFRFHFGNTRKLFICMIYGFLDVSMTPKTKYIWLWVPEITSNKSK